MLSDQTYPSSVLFFNCLFHAVVKEWVDRAQCFGLFACLAEPLQNRASRSNPLQSRIGRSQQTQTFIFVCKEPIMLGRYKTPFAASPSSMPTASPIATSMMLYAFDISATSHLSGFLGQNASTKCWWVDMAFQNFKSFWVWLNNISRLRQEGNLRGPG